MPHSYGGSHSNRAAWGWGLAALLAVLLLVPAVAFAKLDCKGPSARGAIEAQAKKWGPIFGVPVETIMAISQIESRNRMNCANLSIRALPQGGAWGPLQMTQQTANHWAKILSGSKNASARAVASRWKGKGRDLTTDVELAVALSAAMLGALTREFKDFKLVAAGYHQGAGTIRKMLKAGQAIPERLGPYGKVYVANALRAHGTVA